MVTISTKLSTMEWDAYPTQNIRVSYYWGGVLVVVVYCGAAPSPHFFRGGGVSLAAVFKGIGPLYLSCPSNG